MFFVSGGTQEVKNRTDISTVHAVGTSVWRRQWSLQQRRARWRRRRLRARVSRRRTARRCRAGALRSWSLQQRRASYRSRWSRRNCPPLTVMPANPLEARVLEVEHSPDTKKPEIETSRPTQTGRLLVCVAADARRCCDSTRTRSFPRWREVLTCVAVPLRRKCRSRLASPT